MPSAHPDSGIAEPQTRLPADDGAETFSVLVNMVCRFVEAWDAAQSPPDLRQFVPADKGLRKLVLAELIKTDLEYRWVQFNFPKRLHEYRAEFSELAGPGLTADLICEEFLARRNSGLQVAPEEYIDEFPEHAESLRQLLGMNQDFHSTLIVKPDDVRTLDGVEPGTTVDDFELMLSLGKGAFAKVFLARQKSMQRLVAVKVSADSGTEPQTLAQLDHDHIVRVFDQRLLPERKLRLLYMQYVPGGTLQALVPRVQKAAPHERTGKILLDVVDDALEQRGELRPSESSVRQKLAGYSWPETVAWLGARLAAALHYAHGKDVLHRDIKPANVLLTAEGQPKLADFNISYSEKVSGATPAAYFGGSLTYMSPEQLEAFHPLRERQPEDLDERADIYSLGVMLWQLLCGARPFLDDDAEGNWHATLDRMIDVRRRGITEEIAAGLPADCPPMLRRVLIRCLAPDPTDRFQTADDLAQQLEVCLDPQARALIDPVEGRNVRWQRRWAVPMLILMVLIPNIAIAVYNHHFNHDYIVEDDAMKPFVPAFDRAVLWINGIAFPLGIGLGLWLTARVAQPVQSLLSAGVGKAAVARPQKRACIRLGEHASWVCLGLWTVAGFAYPIALHIVSGGLPREYWARFIGSLVICGLLATAYPFFLVTWFAVRRLFPIYIQHAQCGPDDVGELQRLQQRLQAYLIVAVCVPFVAIAGLSLAAMAGPTVGHDALTMFLVCVLSIVAVVLTFFQVYVPLQQDLSALVWTLSRDKDRRRE